MIQEKDLQEFRPQVQYKDGRGITLSGIQNELDRVARENEIPVAFAMDQVKSGGFLGGSAEDCLVLYNPEHEKDYYKFCVRVRYQGNFAFVIVDSYGASKNSNKLSMKGAAKNSLKNGWNKANAAAKAGSNNIGMHLVGGALRGIAGGLAGFGGSKKKAEEEQMYYACMAAIFNEVIR